MAAGLLLALAMPAGALAKPPLVEPDDGPDPRGLTLQGGGVARVEEPPRLNEKTIRRAVDAARHRAQVNALRAARLRARSLAEAAGLTLGAVQAVTGLLSDSERFGGPGRFCRRGRCRAPRLVGESIRVTFATLETSAAPTTGRAIVASANAIASVRSRRRTSPSIRAALGRAQLIADPLALRIADRRSAGIARAAGLQREALFALAEEPRQPFAFDLLNGPFGPGRFCGTIRRFRFRRDPATGERRRVRGRKVRRCYTPAVSSVLRATFVVAG